MIGNKLEILSDDPTANLREEIGEIKLLAGQDINKALELIDVLIARCENSNDLKIKAEIYHLKGIAYERAHQYSGALEWYTKALPLRKAANDKKGEAITLNNIGLAYLHTGRYTDAITNLREALAIKKTLDDYKSYTATCENLGVVFLRISDFKRAVEMHYESLRISEQNQDEQRMATSYQNLGQVHLSQNDNEYALKMFQTALELKKGSADFIQIIQLNNNIGYVLLRLGQHDESLRSFTTCLSMSRERGYQQGEAAAHNNLGEVYMAAGDYEHAMDHYRSCAAIAESHSNPVEMVQANINLSNVYLLKGDLPGAEKLLSEILMQSAASNDIESQQNIYLLLSQLYEKQGLTEKAFEYFKKQDELKGKVLNIENTRVINELKTVHEVDKKEKENEISRLRNIELKDALEELTLEKRRSEKLLLNILPEEIAYEMKKFGKVRARHFEAVTVMFMDVKDFTRISERLTPDQLVSLLDTYISMLDDIITTHGVEKIKTIGDGYLCVSGLPHQIDDHAAVMVHAALEIKGKIAQENKMRADKGLPFFEFRFGIHSGPVVAGIVGKSKYEYDIWGDTVNTAARMEQNSDPGQINISDRTYALAGDAFSYTQRGKIEAKHKGEIDMYFVQSATA